MNTLFGWTAALLAGTGLSFAHADSIALTPVADATLYEMSSLDTPANGAGEYLFVGRIANQNGDRRRSVLRFDVANAIPIGATITSVELRFFVDRTISGAVDLGLHRMSSSWSEGATDAGAPGGNGAPPSAGDATWLHRNFPASLWATPGGDFNSLASATVSVNAEQAYAIASTAALVADVQTWLNAPNSNFGWMLRANELTAPPTAKRIIARENSNAANRPQLIVGFNAPPREPVPIAPWTAPIVISMILLIAGRMWARP